MKEYQPLTRSDWLLFLFMLFFAAAVNELFGLPGGFTQAIISSLILYIDKRYIKIIVFLVIYNSLLFFMSDENYALLFAAFVYGVVFHRVSAWRRFHREKSISN